MTWRRLTRLFRSRKDDADVEAEIRLHVELETEELVRQGVPRDEARRRALVAFGGVDRVREDARDVRRLAWLETCLFDLRYGIRSLRRSPGFTIVAVITLAVGVGANASLYALVDTLMFRAPVGVREPDRLVTVRSARNYVRYLDISEQSKTLTLAAYNRSTISMGTGLDAEEVRVECVTTSYFPVLGARPAVGRTFRQDLNAETREPGIVLSDGWWRRRFGGSPAALGQRVPLAERSFTVIGVMPRAFTGVSPETVDAWILLPVAPEACSFVGRNLLGSSSGSWLNGIARLGDGITLSQADAEVKSLASAEEEFQRATQAQAFPELRALHESRSQRLVADSRLSLWLLGGAAVLLLIACANVAGLLSIRTLDRRRETAVRLQLGASRARVLRQFVLEQCLLAAACGAAAVGVAVALNRLLATFFPYAAVAESFNPTIFGLAAALALGAALAAGLVPALQTSRLNATTLAQSHAFIPQRSAFRSSLLVVQVGLAFVLVVGAGLFVRSVQNTRAGLGYDPDGLFVVSADLRRAGIRNAVEIRQAFEEMTRRLEEVPGVERVGVGSGSFLDAGGPSRVTPQGPPGVGRPYSVMITAVTPSYFATLESGIVRGRAFTLDDHASARPVAIVDEATARDEWPGEDPVGKCFSTLGSDCRWIVGIVESRRRSVRSAEAEHDLLIPLAQAGDEQVPQVLFVRAEDGADVQTAIAAAVRSAIPASPYINVRSFDELADAQTRSWRLGQAMFGWFGFVGLCLSALGLYAVLALAARQRTTEIGVRMALGARPVDIARLVLRHAFLLVGAGWLIGLVVARVSTRHIEGLLFQVEPTDVVTFGGASLVVLLAGAAGCLLPASRAASISPVRALRHE